MPKSCVVAIGLPLKKYEVLRSLYQIAYLDGLVSFNSFLLGLLHTGYLGEISRLRAIGVLGPSSKSSELFICLQDAPKP